MIENSARIAAAVFALGLSLAGPHGVASAEGAEGDTGSESAAASVANEGTTTKSPRAHSGRPSTTAGARGTRTVQLPAWTDIERGPSVAVSPANELPPSVL